MGRAARLAATVALAALACACQQSPREVETPLSPQAAAEYLAGKPQELRKHFYVGAVQGPRNRVLNHMRLGLASLELGHTALAEELFDDSLAGIETIYSNDEAAARARQTFTREAVKDFKGEPYERAMAYYYRGLLYLRAGDYDNARASFKGGFIQDSFAEEDQYKADFALFPFLQGWASRCRGNSATAAEDFREFRAINPDFPLPGEGDDVLLLVETGSAPVKYSATAEGGGKPLKFRRASLTETARVAMAEGQVLPVPMLESVYFQASTRGGREFDSILAGKAQFKEISGTVGNVALVGAAAAANYGARSRDREKRNDALTAAGALALVGLLSKVASEAAEPDADTRYWDNLPDRVHALTLRLPPQTAALSVEFLGSSGTVLRSRQAAVTRAGRCGLAWVRGDSAVPFNPRAPSSAPPQVMTSPVEIPGLPSGLEARAPNPRHEAPASIERAAKQPGGVRPARDKQNDAEPAPSARAPEVKPGVSSFTGQQP